MSQQDQNPVQKLPSSGGRRRFLGAGAAAAPAVLTLVSQPALGTTCFSPSRSLSRNTSVSQQGLYGECRNAESPGNYKAQQTPGAQAYHWPAAIPPSTPFHPTFSGTKFTTGSGSSYRSMTMGEVLNLSGSADPEKMAFHLIGAYLNVNGGNGAVIPSNVITAGEITTIWHEWSTRGYFEPTAGVQWNATAIKYYLVSNGIII
jgi:hypothetical protein